MSSEIKLPNGAKKPIAIADEATAYTLTSVPVGNVYKTNDTGQLMEYRGGGEGTPENWWITRNTNTGDQDLTYIDEELALRAKIIDDNTDMTTLETDGDYLYVGNAGESDALTGVTVCTDVTVINLTADDVLISDLGTYDAIRIEPLQEVKFSTVSAGAGIYSFTESSRKDMVAHSVDKATAKATPVDADLIGITDSADSKALKQLSWANLKATLKTYFDTLYVSLTGNQIIADEKTFTGQMQATGQAATDDDSLMTRELAGNELFFNLGRTFTNTSPSFTNSGTGSVASNAYVGSPATIVSGTSNNGYGCTTIARGLSFLMTGGYGINFDWTLGAAIKCTIAGSGFTDTGNIFRLMVGADRAPQPDGVNAVSYKSFGLEFKARGTSWDWRVYAHDGTTFTASAWTSTGFSSSIVTGAIYMSVVSDGLGGITGYIAIGGSRTLATLTTTGGPVGSGSAPQGYIDACVVNSAAGTTSQTALLQDWQFIAQE